MGTYPVQAEGFEGQTIEISSSSFFSGPKLLINGEPASKGPKRNQMILRRNDGKEVIAFWKPRALGFDVPQLSIDGKDISIVKPLEWFELVWCGISIVLIFFGGLIGGVVGALSFSMNTKIFRSQTGAVMKYLTTGGVSVLAVIIYFIIASLFMAIIN
jgi:hypothetical protein